MSDLFLDIWYGEAQQVGKGGSTQQWVNILGRVSPLDSVDSLIYSLNDGEWHMLSIGADYRRLAGHGDFNIELAYSDLQVGRNIVEIDVKSNDGIAERRTINLTKYKPEPDLPYHIDWSQQTNIQAVAHIVDGLWRVQDGCLWVEETGYDRAIAVGDMTWTSYEIRVPISIYGFAASGSAPMSSGYGVGIALQWQGHYRWRADAYSDSQPRYGYEPIGAMLWYGWDRRYGFRLRLEGHDASTALAVDNGDFQMRFGQDYMLCFRVISMPDSPSQYFLKAWSIDEPEPDKWMIEAQGSTGELKNGSVLLLAHHTLCRFGNIEINPIE